MCTWMFSHLSEIFINIISNAIKYTNNGGVINCDISQTPGKKNGWCDVIITVKDNGIGMSDQFFKSYFMNHLSESAIQR